MVKPREAVQTVTFLDNYCAIYRDLFVDVRSFEAFKSLHLGMISEIARKSLPAIARAVGLANDQALHHCLTESPWSVAALRNRRLAVILQQVKGEPSRSSLMKRATGRRGTQRTMSPDSTSVTWARLRMALFQSMRTGSLDN